MAVFRSFRRVLYGALFALGVVFAANTSFAGCQDANQVGRIHWWSGSQDCPSGCFCPGHTYVYNASNQENFCNGSTNDIRNVDDQKCTLITSGTYAGLYGCTPWGVDGCRDKFYRCPSSFPDSDAKSTAVTQCKGTVTLNKNGGSGTLGSSANWVYVSNPSGTGSATIKMYYKANNTFINASNLTQSGYTFAGGWGTDSSCVTQKRAITVEQATFYACKVYTNHEITLDNNGGTGGTTTLYAQFNSSTTPFRHQTVYLNSARTNAMSTSSGAITKPTKEGYTFKGYYSYNPEVLIVQHCPYLTPLEDETVSKPDPVTGNAETLNIPTACKTISDDGYLTGDGLSIASLKLSTQDTDGITWYAKWSLNSYNIDYVLGDGGTFPSGQDNPSSAYYSTSFHVGTPQRDGWIFAGWVISNMEQGITHYYSSNNSNFYTLGTGTTATGYSNSYFKNLRADDGQTVTFTARWRKSCSAGTYYNATTQNCETCPSGSYCSGTNAYSDITSDQGKTDCSTGYTSATGSSRAEECYLSGSRTTTCDAVYAGTYYALGYNYASGNSSVSCKIYNGTNRCVPDSADACKITSASCATGYTSTTTASALLNVDKTLAGTDWISNDPANDTECKGDCDEDYSVTPGVGEYYVWFNYGRVHGNAICSSVSGNLLDMTNTTPASGGKYCWCNIDSFLPTNSSDISYSFTSSWMSVGSFDNQDDCRDDCSYRCALGIRGSYAYNKNVRSLLYNTMNAYSCQIGIYALILNKNSGSGGDDVVYEKYNNGFYSDSGATNSTSSVTTPTLSGYGFLGYYTASSGGEQIINANGEIIVSNTRFSQNTPLYAHWGKKITLHFDQNTNDTVSNTIPDIECVQGGLCSYFNLCGGSLSIGSCGVMKRYGYNLNGWNLSANGSGNTVNMEYSWTSAAGNRRGETYTFQDVFNNIDSNVTSVTLYAQWAPVTNTIDFDANGGSGGQSASVTATYGLAMPSITSTKPTLDGYAFGGWWDDDGTEVQYYDRDGVSARSWNQTSDITLYARWLEPYVVTLMKNDGTNTTMGTMFAVPDNDDGITYGIYYDSAATNYAWGKNITANGLSLPQRTGYDFTGYYDAPSGGNLMIDSSGKEDYELDGAATDANDDFEIYAQWTPITYTITLDKNANDAVAGTATIFEKYNTGFYSDSGATNEITTVTTPTRSGYDFIGYYTGSTGGERIIDESGNILANNTNKFTQTTTLYAVWAPVDINLQYVYQDENNTVDTDACTYNTGFATPSINNNVRPGYKFMGWRYTKQ